MSYRPPASGPRHIAIDVGDPFLCSTAAQLWVPLGQTFPLACASREQLSLMADAEKDFYVRRELLNRCCWELVQIAEENYEPYPLEVDLPTGYTSAGLLDRGVAASKALECEALVCLYLDGIYIVSERLRTSTEALNEETKNVAWPNIRKERATSKNKKKPTLFNLFENFSAIGIAEAGHAAAFARALEVRGSRTHRRHFQVGLDHQPGEEHPIVHYRDANPYQSTTPAVAFSDRDRGVWSSGMVHMLKWWQENTEKMFRVSVANETSSSHG